MTELSDELLVAYVDGQLARKQALAVDKVLEHDDVIAKRVSALKDAHGRLEAAFEAVLAGEEADAAAQPVAHARGIFIPWKSLIQASLATAGMMLAIGMLLAGFGWPLKMPQFAARDPLPAADPEFVGSVPRDWREEAVRAQNLLGRDSLELGLESQSNPDLIGFQLARAVGPNLVVPDLAPEGYRFMRGQLLRFDGEPLAQLLYLSPSGAPLALYAKAGRGDSPLRVQHYGKLSGVSWAEAGIAYLLAGEADEARLRKLAEAIGKTQKPAAFADQEPAAPPLPKPKPKP
jgi:anti-sigma factor RsiW